VFKKNAKTLNNRVNAGTEKCASYLGARSIFGAGGSRSPQRDANICGFAA